MLTKLPTPRVPFVSSTRPFSEGWASVPFHPFRSTLLTELNVAPAQLHPNSWAFVRAFTILCCHLGLTPSVDVFLYFFEAKDSGKKLWVSLNGVVGRVLLTLFQQSYKGFK